MTPDLKEAQRWLRALKAAKHSVVSGGDKKEFYDLLDEATGWTDGARYWYAWGCTEILLRSSDTRRTMKGFFTVWFTIHALTIAIRQLESQISDFILSELEIEEDPPPCRTCGHGMWQHWRGHGSCAHYTHEDWMNPLCLKYEI